MDPLRIISEQHGFFTRAMARDCGYNDKQVTAHVRAKVWHRFRRGYYAFTDVWATYDDTTRHLVRCRAVLHSLGPDVVLSHVSGLLAHGISTWGTSLDRVHVTRLDGDASRIEGDVVHHRGTVLESEIVETDGMRALAPARCAVEYASRSPSESALVAFDSALHGGHCTREELFARFAEVSAWPGMRHVHVPIRLCSGRSESVGESRGFWLFWVAGLPAPERQFEVRNQDGELRATCDWGWPELDTVGEFDGKLKYGRILKPGQDPGEVVFAEKQREDEVRELTGGTMIRLIWADYDRPRVTIARLQRVLRRRRAG